MKNKYQGAFSGRLMTSTGLALIAALSMAEGADAQQGEAQPTENIQEVIVIGSRASQQSANERKKRAKTAQDSIVADDVGSFPDRNLNEALSRVPGASIERNEFGEGSSVNIRGGGPDLTRVELDGMGVQGSGFSVAVNGGNGNGRGADMRELPADLIKSVDVIKGNTPDLTEGGLGASVLIKTRTGLDFKKPYFQLRVGGQRNSLSERISPDIGIVAARKFLNNRLGVVFNLSSTRVLNDGHSLNNAGTNNRAGYTRLADFDNSPDKTFTFNPDLTTGPNADEPFGFAGATAGTTFTTNTPRTILAKSAEAKTKAECDALFPRLTQTELNTISSGARAGAANQRNNERVTCLNQWNDYAPNAVRDQMITQYEDRLAWDLRMDFRVNDHLTIYAKYSVAERLQDENNRQRTRGGLSFITAASAGNVTLPLTNNTTFPITSVQQPSVVPGSGYYLYNGSQTTGSVTLDNTAGSTTTNNGFPLQGIAVNVVPGSIVMDENHHLTSFDITNASMNIDHISNEQNWKTNYLQLGANYRNGPLNIDFLASRGEASYSRTDRRMSRGYVYGNATMFANESGVWDFKLPSTYDETDMSNYVRLNAPTAVGMPSYTNNTTLQFNPRLNEGEERQVKLDATYSVDGRIPFFTQFKTGVQYRENRLNAWGGGGYSPAANVFMPSLNARGAIRACENVATTTTANACAYGYVPATGSSFLWGTETMTRQQMIDLYQSTVETDNPTFFNGYDDLSVAVKSWNSIDVDRVYDQLIQTKNYTFDCIKRCTASDGKVYDQQYNRSVEKISAAYYMAEFEQALPWNMEFGGNFGVRMVKTEVQGTGFVTLTSIIKTPTYDPANRDAPGGTTTVSINGPVSIDRSYTDWMPSYNMALWVVPDKVVLRYSWSRSIARPPLGRQWPAGTCTFDQRFEGETDSDGSDRDQRCGTFGNPELKPFKANKTNTSIEWYPNRDTSLSLAYWRQKVLVGGPVTTAVTGVPLFAGSDATDPQTGMKFSDIDFGYTTYVNGEGYTQKGWEFSTKTAFTFLPWHLRYTGADLNISKSEQSGTSGSIDPLTGMSYDPSPPLFLNLSLWYDDGKTNARLAYQKRDQIFTCISSCGDNTVNNFPTENPSNRVALPYNPGEPYFVASYQYLDGKITHKFTPNVEVYFEGRNLLKQGRTTLGSPDRGFTAGQNPWSVQYGGRRFMFGVTYRMM